MSVTHGTGTRSSHYTFDDDAKTRLRELFLTTDLRAKRYIRYVFAYRAIEASPDLSFGVDRTTGGNLV